MSALLRRSGTLVRRTRLRQAFTLAAMAVCALSVQQCGRAPAEEPPGAAITPVLSVKELMEHMIDPTADWIFDAAVIEVNEKGITETIPLTADDWLKVERGAMGLAEFSNLLKIPRPVAPAGHIAPEPPANGGPAPELTPQQIQEKIDEDRAAWNRYADGLRVVALEALDGIRKKDAQQLFKIGGDIDQACEKCHLEYWYPGDKKFVLEDQKKSATYTKPTDTPTTSASAP